MRAFPIPILLAFALAVTTGCPGEGGPGSLITNGAEVPDRDPDDEFTGDLSDGEWIDNEWFEDQGCWPGTENLNFSGNHVLFEEAQPADEDIYVKVSPAGLVDASLYVLQAGATTTDLPPDLSNTIACDAEYDRENDLNPGEAEAVKVIGGSNAYRIIIGVAGANGATTGEFTVEYWIGD